MFHFFCILPMYSWDSISLTLPKGKVLGLLLTWCCNKLFLHSWWWKQNVKLRSLIELNSFTSHLLLLKLGTVILEICSSPNLGNCKKANFTQTQAFQTSLIILDFLYCAFKLCVLYKKHTGDNFSHIFLVWLLFFPGCSSENTGIHSVTAEEKEWSPAFLF